MRRRSNGQFEPKLTEWQARYILDAVTLDIQLRLEAGFKTQQYGLYRRLAEKFNVKPETVRAIARRHRWKRLPRVDILKLAKEI